jgi:hypothetical protein
MTGRAKSDETNTMQIGNDIFIELLFKSSYRGGNLVLDIDF